MYIYIYVIYILYIYYVYIYAVYYVHIYIMCILLYIPAASNRRKFEAETK